MYEYLIWNTKLDRKRKYNFRCLEAFLKRWNISIFIGLNEKLQISFIQTKIVGLRYVILHSTLYKTILQILILSYSDDPLNRNWTDFVFMTRYLPISMEIGVDYSSVYTWIPLAFGSDKNW